MNKLCALLLVLATPAFADPEPAASPPTAPPAAPPPTAPPAAPPPTAPPAAAPVPVAPPAAAPVVSPWGSSPYVVAYDPPPEIDRSHRGLTLEFALGAGTTSLDESAGSVTFAIGGWLSHDVALAFRVTGVGAYSLVGGSLQYYATDSLWLGAGLGSFSERTMDDYYGTDRVSGGGGFVRTGYNLAGKAHALYVSGELQAGSIDGELRAAGLLAIGYQLL